MLDARHDFDDVSRLTKAEMARFEKEKVDDFKKALEDFADTMAARQREVRPLPPATYLTATDVLAVHAGRPGVAALPRPPRRRRRVEQGSRFGVGVSVLRDRANSCLGLSSPSQTPCT